MNTEYQETLPAEYLQEYQYDTNYEYADPYDEHGRPHTSQNDLNELRGPRDNDSRYYTTGPSDPLVGGGAVYTTGYGAGYQAVGQYASQNTAFSDVADMQSLATSVDNLYIERPEIQQQIQSGSRISYSSPRVRGTRGSADQEVLDPSWKTRNSDYKKFFTLGRVFKTVWTEPYAGGDNLSQFSRQSSVSEVSFGQKVFTKIRRFVVVRYVDRYCICLPVTTYDGKGYWKRGINLSDHGLIYTGRLPANPTGITLPPVELVLNPREVFKNPSYVNYARCHSVETNIRVKDVGRLVDESCKVLFENYKSVQLNFDGEENYTLARQTNATLTGIDSGLLPSASNSNVVDDSVFERITRPARFFAVGRVFKVQWAELAGTMAEDGSPFIIPTQEGEPIFQKIRHFVVVRKLRDHCLCLPLNTYDGQGALKYRADPADYAAVFAFGTPAPDTSAEELQKSPFPIVVEAETETIDRMSRINFRRVYTVEYNVRVANVGRIHPDYLDQLDQYFVDSISQSSETLEQEGSSFPETNPYPTPTYDAPGYTTAQGNSTGEYKWSDWEWDAKRGKFYRSRINSKGKTVWESRKP